jgi:general secretion pathway protein K
MIRQPGGDRQAGFALLIVLATLGLLALLVAGLAAAGRTRIGLAQSERGSAAAEAAADGAVQRAIFQLRGGAWLADGGSRRVAIGGAIVDVVMDDEAGRINPNFSPPALLAALIGAIGPNPAQARALARRIVDWRTATPYSIDGGLKLDAYRQAGLPYGPPDRAFESADEIGLVAGVTPDILNGLRPYVSVFQSGDPRPGALAQSALRDAEAINHGSVLAGFSGQDQTVRIRAAATLADGSGFVRTAVVRLRPKPMPGQTAWLILSWD